MSLRYICPNPIDTPGFVSESSNVDVSAIKARIPQTGFFSTSITESKIARAKITILGEENTIAMPRSAPTRIALLSINSE
jgi:hypothetical protein